MTEISASEAAEVWVVTFTLVLARVSALVLTFPLFGQRHIPRLVKVGFSLALTLAWLSTYTSDNSTVPVPSTSWVRYASAMVGEIFVGALLGYAFGLLMLPMRIAGTYIGQEMGFNLGQITDPSAQSSSNETGIIFELLGTLLFLSLNAHHTVLLTLHASFSVLQFDRGLAYAAWRLYGQIFSSVHEAGFLLIAPLATCLFVTLLVLAILMRVWPQINLFSFGIGARLAVGLIALLVLFPNLMSRLQQFLESAAVVLPRVLLGV